MKGERRQLSLSTPGWALSLALSLAMIGLWAVIRLWLSGDELLPLTYTLPLLLHVWTRKKSLLLLMAFSFLALAAVEFQIVLPVQSSAPPETAAFIATLINIVAVWFLVHLIMGLRDRIEQKNLDLQDRNEQLAAREEEISQQNEELQSQSEELRQQNEELRTQGEEMEQQSEELTSQSEDLQAANDELARREEMLQGLLSAARWLSGEAEVLTEVCRHGLRLLGEGVVGAAVVEARGDMLHMHAQVGVRVEQGAAQLPLEQSLAAIVMKESRTAALQDVGLRPDLRFAESADGQSFRSILATPLRLGNTPVGAVEFYANTPRSWTEDQFRLAEWVAAQCATVLEMLRLRDRLRREESQLRTIVDSLSEGVVVSNMDQLLRWNAAAIQMHGFASLEECQRRLEDFTETFELSELSGEAIPPEQWPLARVLRGEALRNWEVRVRRLDRSDWERIFSYNGSLVRDHGAPQMAVISVSDVTAQRRAAEQTKQSDLFYRQTLESIPGMVFTTRPDGYCDYQSQQWAEFTGIPTSAHIGDGWNQLLHPEDRPRAMKAWQAAVKDSAPYDVEYRVRRFDGQYEWFQVRGRPIRDSEGNIVRWFGVASNIQRIKGTEKALLDAKNAAEAANAAKDHFLAVLSHELRTPLNPALMAATIVENDPELPPRLREDVSIIRRNVELEARLIEDMLDLTRIERGKLTLNRRVINGCEVLQHAIGICDGEAAEKALQLETSLPQQPIWVQADPARLQQVFWNLIKNAIKFTPPGGRITVSASARADGGLRVEITDTGRGISADLLANIFNAFEQGSSQITREFGGLGLGLAICRGLVELHQGTIAAHSDGPDTGATFVVELPAAECPAPATSDPPGRPQPASGESWNILLVEDHETTARITARLLSGFGHRVSTAACVAKAAELFDQHRFDLVISDLGLPDGSGRDLLKKLLARRPVKAIALSGFGMDSDIRQSAEVGFLEHLTKPINVEQLENAIRRAMGS